MAKKKQTNFIKRIKDFFVDVKEESKKVIWTSKNNLIKYSVATLVFMIFICVFFVGTNALVALVSKLKELIG